MIKKRLISCIISLITVILLVFNSSSYAQINTAKMDSINLQFNKASFKKTYINKLDIKANNVNFAAGNIKSISVICNGIKQKDFFIERLSFTFHNALFNSERLLSGQELLLKQPVNATGSITITETNINAILNNPKTLKKLSNLSKVTIKQLGLKMNAGLISFVEPKAQILSNNTIRIDMVAALAKMIGFPVTLQTQISIQDGKIILINPKIITSGVGLPEELSGILNNKLNSIIDINEKLKEDVDIKFTSLTVTPHSSINIKANALIKKLNFKKKKK